MKSNPLAVVMVIILLCSVLTGNISNETMLSAVSTAGKSAVSQDEEAGTGTADVYIVPQQAKIEDAEDFYSVLHDYKTVIGYTDDSEFELPRERQTLDVKSYTAAQKIGDIPVEGGEIRFVCDNDGNARCIINHYIDPERAAIGDLVSFSEAYEIIGPEHVIISAGKVILPLEDGTSESAWKFIVNEDGTVSEKFVSSISGSVIGDYSLTMYNSVVGYGTTENKREGVVSVMTEYDPDTNKYYLQDVDNRIKIYDLHGKKASDLKYDQILRPNQTSKDYYTFDEKANADARTAVVYHNGKIEPGHSYVFNMDTGEITDNGVCVEKDVYREVAFVDNSFNPLKMFFDTPQKYYEPASDKDTLWKNNKAIGAMKSMEEIMQFFNNVLLLNDFGNRNDFIINVAVNTVHNNGGKSVEWSIFGEKWAVILIAANEQSDLTLLAHEYTHCLIYSYANLGDGYKYPEASALDEGLADLMAVCCEDYIKGSTFWHVADRSIIDPLSDGNPIEYKGNNWKEIKTSKASTFAYDNSTVISHMGFMMATGKFERSDDTEPLGTENLAKLILNSMEYLSKDTDFTTYVTILCDVARVMKDKGELTDGQLNCIYEAIREVGLEPDFIGPKQVDFVVTQGAIAVQAESPAVIVSDNASYTIVRENHLAPDGSVTYIIDNWYDENEILRRTEEYVPGAEKLAGYTTYEYDDLNRLVNETVYENDEYSKSGHWDYDGDSNRVIRMTWEPASTVTTYSYDKNGYLTWETMVTIWDDGIGILGEYEYCYLREGELVTQRIFYNPEYIPPELHAEPVFVFYSNTLYTYDSNGHLIGEQDDYPYRQVTYTLNDAGLPIKEVISEEERINRVVTTIWTFKEYSYDEMNRLIEYKETSGEKEGSAGPVWYTYEYLTDQQPK